MRGVFVTGTDTGVGKTTVSVGLLKLCKHAGLHTVGMKPVASGSRQTEAGARNEDALALQAAAGLVRSYDQVNPYSFVPAIAPHLAAAEAGIQIHLPHIIEAYQALCVGADSVVVEGVGGWQVPLSGRMGMHDLAKALALPVILVVGMRLGCLNHALLSARAIRADGLKLAGWVANGIDPDFERRAENLETLNEQLRMPLLGDIAWQPEAAEKAIISGLDAVGVLKLLASGEVYEC